MELRLLEAGGSHPGQGAPASPSRTAHPPHRAASSCTCLEPGAIEINCWMNGWQRQTRGASGTGRPGPVGRSENTIWRLNRRLSGKREEGNVLIRLWFQPDISGTPVASSRMLSNTKPSWLFLKAPHNATGSLAAGWEIQHVPLYKRTGSGPGN